jgi:hypothetical protein
VVVDVATELFRTEHAVVLRSQMVVHLRREPSQVRVRCDRDGCSSGASNGDRWPPGRAPAADAEEGADARSVRNPVRSAA